MLSRLLSLFSRSTHPAVVLYNTKTRQKELFTPLARTVRMYSCGPTVYSTPHIGNLRSVIFSDILYRTLVHAGYPVQKVMNITDVGHLASDADTGEDKMEKAAREKGKRAADIAQMYTDIFFDNLEKLNIDTTNTTFPRATEYIEAQIAMVATLEDKGYTYTTSDGVYFDTSRFPAYGDFAHLDIAGLNAGERVDMGEKRNPTDFALWKLSPQTVHTNTDETGTHLAEIRPVQKRDQEWDSPWGVGFPGWHIECSAMSRALLGKHFDIHTGGIDHIPVHHTNEIAQSECANGCPYVNYWMHNAFLSINNGEKMAKSGAAGESFSLAGIMSQGFEPLALRYYFLGAQYRTQMDFSWEALKAAQSGYRNLKKKILNLRQQTTDSLILLADRQQTHSNVRILTKYAKKFDVAVYDDLNTAQALAALHEVVGSTEDPERVLATVAYMDEVLGLKLLDETVGTDTKTGPHETPEHIQTLLDQRAAARAQKNWAESDRLRDALKEAGYEVKDTPEGQTVAKN